MKVELTKKEIEYLIDSVNMNIICLPDLGTMSKDDEVEVMKELKDLKDKLKDLI